MDYSPWGRKELGTTEQLSFHFILKSAEGCLSHPHPSCELKGHAHSLIRLAVAMTVALMTDDTRETGCLRHGNDRVGVWSRPGAALGDWTPQMPMSWWEVRVGGGGSGSWIG